MHHAGTTPLLGAEGQMADMNHSATAPDAPTPVLDRRSSPLRTKDYLPPPFPKWREPKEGNDGEWLPAWATYRKVRLMAEPRGEGQGQVPEVNAVAGPAVLHQFSAMAALTYFFTLIFCIQYYTATCEKEKAEDSGDFGAARIVAFGHPGNTQRMAFAPTADVILWSFFFFPAAITLLAIQHMCLRYVLPSMLARVRAADDENVDFELILFGVQNWNIPFRLWYASQSVLMLFNLLDNMTNAMFASRLVATYKLSGECTEYEEVQDKWFNAWSQSPLFGTLVQALGSDKWSFESIVGWYYFFQLFIQPLVALYLTLPYHYWPCCRCKFCDNFFVFQTARRSPKWAIIDGRQLETLNEQGQVVDAVQDPQAEIERSGGRASTADVRAVRSTLSAAVRQEAEYTTLADGGSADDGEDYTDYKSAFLILAEATRMELFTSQDLIYRRVMSGRLHRELDDLELTLGITPDSAELTPEVKKQKTRLTDDILELANTAILRGVMRFGLKGFIQNAIMVNFQTSLVAIGRTMTSPDADDAFNNFTVLLTVLGMVADIPDMINLLAYIWREKGHIDQSMITERKKTIFRRRVWGLMALVVLYVLFAFLSLEKLVNAYRCACGTSNVDGCTIPENWFLCVYAKEDGNYSKHMDKCVAAGINIKGQGPQPWHWGAWPNCTQP